MKGPQPGQPEPQPSGGVVQRRFAVYDDRELISIVTAVSFFPPAVQVGPVGDAPGNLVFHDHSGLPTAVFASGSWSRAETAAAVIPDAPPVDMGSEVA